MINIREERSTDVVARENLLDEAYGAVRFAKASERLREGRCRRKACRSSRSSAGRSSARSGSGT